MKHMGAILATMMAAFCAMAEKQPFDRYQSILDRMPFGQPPPGFDPTRDPSEVSKDEYSQSEVELTQEQEAIQKAVRFSVINVESDGTVRVGFSDLTDPKAPRHFYLAVGEVRGGWSVKDADPNEKKMTVEKDGVEVELTLGENSSGMDGKAVANARRGTASKPQRSPLLGRTGAGETGGTPMTLRGRREKREAEEAAKRAEDEKLAAERERERLEREKREEEERAQREAERAEQREQLNALKAELMRQREEAKAARERGEDSENDSEDEEESEDE